LITRGDPVATTVPSGGFSENTELLGNGILLVKKYVLVVLSLGAHPERNARTLTVLPSTIGIDDPVGTSGELSSGSRLLVVYRSDTLSVGCVIDSVGVKL
jgi:hypothetical protein